MVKLSKVAVWFVPPEKEIALPAEAIVPPPRREDGRVVALKPDRGRAGVGRLDVERSRGRDRAGGPAARRVAREERVRAWARGRDRRRAELDLRACAVGVDAIGPEARCGRDAARGRDRRHRRAVGGDDGAERRIDADRARACGRERVGPAEIGRRAGAGDVERVRVLAGRGDRATAHVGDAASGGDDAAGAGPAGRDRRVGQREAAAGGQTVREIRAVESAVGVIAVAGLTSPCVVMLMSVVGDAPALHHHAVAPSPVVVIDPPEILGHAAASVTTPFVSAPEVWSSASRGDDPVHQRALRRNRRIRSLRDAARRKGPVRAVVDAVRNAGPRRGQSCPPSRCSHSLRRFSDPAPLMPRPPEPFPSCRSSAR